MGIADGMIDVLRDWKRIADKPPGEGASRLDLWRTHLGLKLARVSRRRRSEAAILAYRVTYLDHASLVHLFREIFVDRVYHVPLTSKAPTIIDCGSNIGMSILYFKDLYPDARIVGFEPHPLVYRTLVRNMENNALRDVALHQKAVGDRPGTIEFFVKGNDPGALDMSMFAGRGNSSSIVVETEVLSDHINGEVDLLKLDIEGAEGLVLMDLAQRDKLRQVRHIVCEYHHHLDARHDHLSRTLATLEEAGFGYQIAAHYRRPERQYEYQDIIIYAYRKGLRPT